MSVILGESLVVLKKLNTEMFDLIYIDPPFNTGKTRKIHGREFSDSISNYIDYIKERVVEGHRTLKSTGSFFLHIDYREVHYLKVMLDSVFGRECFKNDIIWAYDYGGRPKTKWPCKHDNILWYVKDPKHYTFNYSQMDRIPYMAPGLVGPEKASRGKTPTDVWWNTIVPTNSKERVGYPTQKPLAILERIIKVHSNPGDIVLDFFAGSGTLGVAASNLGRKFMLIDNNQQAIDVMKKRLPYGTTFGVDRGY